MTDSDKNFTTMASNTFDRLLRDIQSSNLNFHLQVSPFSAQISIKKSLVRERDETFRLPVLPQCDFAGGKEFDKLCHDCAQAINECANKDEELAASKSTISILAAKLAKAEAEAMKIFNERKFKADILKKQIKVLQSENLEDNVKRLKNEVMFLRNKKKNLEEEIPR